METKYALEDVLRTIIVLDHFIHCLLFFSHNTQRITALVTVA
jgi:hypothetical protein